GRLEMLVGQHALTARGKLERAAHWTSAHASAASARDLTQAPGRNGGASTAPVSRPPGARPWLYVRRVRVPRIPRKAAGEVVVGELVGLDRRLRGPLVVPIGGQQDLARVWQFLYHDFVRPLV